MKNFGVSLLDITNLDGALRISLGGIWIEQTVLKTGRSLLAIEAERTKIQSDPDLIANIPKMVIEKWQELGINALDPTREDSERIRELLDGKYSYLKIKPRAGSITKYTIDAFFMRFMFERRS